jgi:hypothetical protein
MSDDFFLLDFQINYLFSMADRLSYQRRLSDTSSALFNILTTFINLPELPQSTKQAHFPNKYVCVLFTGNIFTEFTFLLLTL